MSLEQHAFLRTSQMPTRDEWQAKIGELGMPLELYPELKMGEDKGFSPCTLKGQPSGFEIYFDSVKEVLGMYPDIRETVGDRDRCISFRWGGDFDEYVCVLAASAALAQFFDAIVYYPDDATLYSTEKLVENARMWLEE